MNIKHKLATLCQLMGFLVVVLLRAIRPIVRVRIGILHHYMSFGHLAYNNDLYLRRRARRQNRAREVDIFITGEPSNRQLLTMVKRRMTVIENRLLVRMVRQAQERTKWSDVWINLKATVHEYDEYNNSLPQLSFTPEEESKGRELLRLIGVQPGNPFVCFHARDARAADVKRWSALSNEQVAFYSEEFKNSSIHNYLPAAEYLVSQGLYALRVGFNVAEKIKLANNRIINYAEESSSDFGNVYLIAKCKFILVSLSGPYGVAAAFGVPVAMVNLAPVFSVPIGANHLFIPKKLRYMKEKRPLTFPEILDKGIEGWTRNGLFTQAGIEVIENTSDEVLALAKEMNARLDGTWVTTEEDEYLQQRFRDLIPPGHYFYGFPSRIGAEFLRQNRSLLER